ncbi:extracellular solute-binding protein [Curtobacterium sp. MCBD17_040]|uniref:ABC transporter substrate-binding protein n=1 Tax=Curtobacterium sp. MCBD17_040 TaxID=2175674 RepID=UPI0015E8E5C1|nr:extracellular solute-binding protein [Curtobacterium sp. MCBD17_040]WIB65261.1 extracellular solute-binding protein [Curtobacterium sp. MCBD17_040]
MTGRIGERTSLRVALAALTVTTLAGALAGCSSGSSSSGGTTTISYLSYFNDSVMRPVIKEFEKENPKIKVKLSSEADPSNYAQALQTRISGNKTPDIFNLTGANQYDIMSNHLALDLTGQSSLDGIAKSNFASYKLDGKIYGLPVTGWASGIVYNKAILKKIGYSAPPTTLTAFVKMGEKLKTAGYTPYLEDETEFSPSLSALIGSYYQLHGDEQGDNIVLNGKTTFAKEWTPALEEWKKDYIDTGIIPQSSLGLTSDQALQAFVSGQTAMYRTGAWDIATLKKSKVDYGFSPFPGYPGGKPSVGGGADVAFAVSSKVSGATKTASEKFLSFLNSKPGLKSFSTSYGDPSISSKYTTSVDPAIAALFNTYLAKGDAYWMTFTKGANTMSNQVYSQEQALVSGKTTPAAFAKSMDTTWKSVK